MTIMELVTKLYVLSAEEVDMAAKAAVQAGIPGAKDVYMAWGKEKGIAAKELEAAYKEAQPAKSSGGPRGFADMYYDWLAESSREEQEAHDYIMGNESQNVRNHLTHYLNIWALAETVRRGHKVARTITAGKASPKPKADSAKKAQPEQEKDTWEYDAANPYRDVRSSWETLERVKNSKRPSKTKVHPDKVAYLNDAELTAAYTKAFQIYSK